MSGDDDFLARWSRRKRAVAEAGKAAPDAVDVKVEGTAVAPVQPRKPEDENPPPAEAPFDPASLPPIDSITALSDIRDFLRAGVPPDLTRAALRRVWTTDPAIRDFVGLAENAWDFTDPKAMPGFGPLEATDDVVAMVTKIMSGQVPPPPNAADPPLRVEPGDDSAAVAAGEPADVPDQPVTVAAESAADIAAQHEDGESKPLLRRGHGGALPH